LGNPRFEPRISAQGTSTNSQRRDCQDLAAKHDLRQRQDNRCCTRASELNDRHGPSRGNASHLANDIAKVLVSTTDSSGLLDEQKMTRRRR
jgi:hypothetical protein